jgi:chorismate--pyruvate lyase
MNDTAASAEHGAGLRDDGDAEAPAVPASAMWLPGTALGCYEGDAQLRSWLLTPGLLTQRIRAAAGKDYRMHLLGEHTTPGGGHLREIAMACGESTWLYARTQVPAATLAAQPWLARIGTVSLGEAIAARGGVQRSDFAFARLLADTGVVRRALEVAGLPPQALWVRRSTFRTGGDPATPLDFDLFEVFLPDIAAGTASALAAAAPP